MNRDFRISVSSRGGKAVLFGFALVLCAAVPPAQALQLTPAQLKLAEQLPPSEKAKLAASAGIALPSEALPSHVPPADQNAGPVQVTAPQKEEGPSALEERFNARLVKGLFMDLAWSRAQPVVTDLYTGAASLPLPSTAGYSPYTDTMRPRSQPIIVEGAYAKLNGETQHKPFDSDAKDAELRAVLENSLSLEMRLIDQKLKQFGYDLFAGPPSSFAPVTDIPIPPEYVLGPGDELYIQYYGRRSDRLALVVDREGVVELPDVGPITVAGLPFAEAKAMLAQKIRESLIGVTASISMGRLRSIRVFVLGDARSPGSYLVSSLSTISNALFLAGGVSKKGSLRHVLLKRDGKIVRDLDLYDFLLKGSSKNDARLLPGDIIFIPPIGKVVAVAGEVVRPGIYELREERSVSDLVRLAGGPTPYADLAHVQIDRIQQGGDRTLIDINLKQRKQDIRIRNGDLIAVYPVPGRHKKTVTLLGQVKRPGVYGFREGMKIGELLRSRDDLLDDAYLEYALIQRTNPVDRSLKVLRVPLKSLLDERDESANIALQDEDKVFVLAKSAIEPLDSVAIGGEVVNPGKFPLTKGMRIVDLVLAAGGVTKRAYLKQAEVTRYTVVNDEKREAEHFQVDLAAALAGDESANIPLQPDDVVTIRALSNWRDVEHVVLSGEVRFPGTYPIEDGERLSSVLERAGGFTDKAYLPAAVFTRATIREEQQKKLAEMASQMENEIARLESEAVNLSDPKAMAQRQASIASAKKMLEQMKQAKATGRLVIELKDIQALKGTDYDIALRDGDSLYIPKKPNEVLVMGQVYNSTAFLYRKQLDVDDYIERAGGLTRLADEDHIYVVHASGIVEPVRRGWRKTRIGPGDAIVVPENLEQFNVLDSALDWSKVLYQLGTALASMKVIGIL